MWIKILVRVWPQLQTYRQRIMKMKNVMVDRTTVMEQPIREIRLKMSSSLSLTQKKNFDFFYSHKSSFIIRNLMSFIYEGIHMKKYIKQHHC